MEFIYIPILQISVGHFTFMVFPKYTLLISESPAVSHRDVSLAVCRYCNDDIFLS